MKPAPFVALADPARPMPAGALARLDAARAALVSLAGEERRLERLGLEWPLARCREQRRYWRFVAALCVLSPDCEGE